MCGLLAFCSEVWERLGKLSSENKKGNYFNDHRYNTADNTPSRSNRHDGTKPGIKHQHVRSGEPRLLPGALTGLAAGPTLGGAKLFCFVCTQARSPTVKWVAWNKFWCFPLQAVSRAARFCCRERSATDAQLYLLLWYILYVPEVQGALGVQASQEGPGKRKWKPEDIRSFHTQDNWAYRRKAKVLRGPHLTKKFCVKWLEGRLSIQLRGRNCQVNFNI